MCVWNICVIPTFLFPPVVTSLWDEHRTNSDSATFNICQSPRPDCVWKRPSQFVRRCLLVRRAVFLRSPSPQVTPGKWESCSMSCSLRGADWAVPTDSDITEAEVPLVHARGTFSWVPSRAQMPPTGDILFTLFRKGRAGSWRCVFFLKTLYCFNVSLTKHLP